MDKLRKVTEAMLGENNLFSVEIKDIHFFHPQGMKIQTKDELFFDTEDIEADETLTFTFEVDIRTRSWGIEGIYIYPLEKDLSLNVVLSHFDDQGDEQSDYTTLTIPYKAIKFDLKTPDADYGGGLSIDSVSLSLDVSGNVIDAEFSGSNILGQAFSRTE